MCLISRFLVPMPLTPLQNGFGNGISGLLSGFFWWIHWDFSL